MKHRVRLQTWIDGILETLEHEFETMEHALGFGYANSKKETTVKIYDANNQLTHHLSGVYNPENMYA